ncbi:hypothetical protein EYF80_066134 [Liparis tanakae]|uniref:Uncharacterized protein n=1 Tax=Liparis tanakae TaxID=230148 RepID=A0A4Z2E548_9TELE|nr:hypothetical protein EYF80_066134 [Liparis tanakae]
MMASPGYGPRMGIWQAPWDSTKGPSLLSSGTRRGTLFSVLVSIRRQSFGTRTPERPSSSSPSTRPRRWMWTGRTTPPSPPAARTCASTCVGWAATGRSRPSRATRMKLTP